MFLTRMVLDTNRPETQQAVALPETLRPLIRAAADCAPHPYLWRFDRIRNRTYLTIVSIYRPNMYELYDRFGIAGAFPSWQTEDYDEILDLAEEGTVWAFQLCAGTEALPASEKQVFQRLHDVHLRSGILQRDWLLRQRAEGGFYCDASDVNVLHSGLVTLHPGTPGRAVLFHQIRYGGVLTVTDRARFHRTLTEGLGHGRGFGMGLMTIDYSDGLYHV